MKKLLLTALLFMMSILATSCTAGNNQPAPAASNADIYNKIETGDVKKLMDSGEAVIIVDVRTAEEYESGHLPGAVNIPVETISDEKPAALPVLDAQIVIYCRSGNRTVTAYKKLAALGYTNVHDMGGIVDWPYETVTGPAATDSVPADTMAEPGGVMSHFKSTDISGKPVNQSIFADKKLTLVNVWATFCPPCLKEMPDLGELNRQYADRGFQVVGLVTDATDRDGAPNPDMITLVEEIIDKTDADYLHILPSEDLYEMLGQMEYVPTTIFVDSDGRQVGEMHIGAKSADDWAKLIESLLDEVG